MSTPSGSKHPPLGAVAYSAADWTLYDHLPDAVLLVGADGRVAFANSQSAVLFGWAVDDLLGLPVEQLIPERYRERHAGQRQSYREKVSARPMGAGIELYARRADGSEVPVDIMLKPLGDYAGRVIVVLRDIADRRRAEESLRARDQALRDSEQRFRHAMETAGVGLWEWNVTSDRVEWSPMTFAQFGLDPSLPAPTHAEWSKMLVDPAEARDIQQRIQTCIAGDARQVELTYRIQHPKRGERWLTSIAEVVRNADGKALRITGINVDVTDRMLYERDLQAAKAEAEKANALKSRFLAAASHDLRQPLQTINIVRTLLARIVHDPAAVAYLETLGNASRSMDELLSALLDINRLESGAIAPRIETVALGSVLARVASDLAQLAENKGLMLSVAVVDENVRTDSSLLGVILRNLIGNAIKYTERGSISVATHCDATDLWLEVRDTGIGISRENLTRIFDEFYQVENESRDRRRGVGLGLSIVQRLAKLLELELQVESEPGRGTVFRIRLPRVGAPESSPALSNEPAPAASPATGACRILHIEDDVAVAHSMAVLLKMEGYVVTTVGTAAAALALIDSGYRPDLLLTDYQLPASETGVRLVQQLAVRLGRRPPTVLLSGDMGERVKDEAAGVVDYMLPKPVAVDRLLDTLAVLARKISSR